MYTKPEWTPVTTELNDFYNPPPTTWEDPIGDLRRAKQQMEYEGTGAGLTHADWCQDKTCHCQRD